MKKLLLFLRPNCVKIALLVVFTLISLAVTTGGEATSKVTWHANRGFPFPVITISDYVPGGRCSQNTICLAVNIQDFYPYALLLDILGWYLVSCAMVFVYQTMKKQCRASNLGV
jgi:hypothetical protein